MGSTKKTTKSINFWLLVSCGCILSSGVVVLVDGGTSTPVIKQIVEKRTAPSSFKWQVRLVNATLPFEGRVEVKLTPTGEWGSVCDDDWDAYDAQVVCRMLGFNHAKARAIRAAGYGAAHTAAPIHLDEVRCTGEERSLTECDYSVAHNCEHNEDAGVLCQGALEDHFEHTAQLPKVFERLRSLTEYFETLRQGHFALKNETDALWRQLNESAIIQNRFNSAQTAALQQHIAANQFSGGHGNFSSANQSIDFSQINSRLTLIERSVNSTLSLASDSGSVIAARHELTRLDQQVQQLQHHLHWLLVGLAIAAGVLVLSGICLLARRNVFLVRRKFSDAENEAMKNNNSSFRSGQEPYFMQPPSGNVDNSHQPCIPQQPQQPRFEYQMQPNGQNMPQQQQFNRSITPKTWMSSYRRQPVSNANNNNTIHMQPFFTTSSPLNVPHPDQHLPATPTSCTSQQLQQQQIRQQQQQALPPQCALPPVPTQYNPHHAATAFQLQQQQDEANHRAAMAAVAAATAAQQLQQKSMKISTNTGYESASLVGDTGQPQLRYSTIMTDPTESEATYGSVPPSPGGGVEYTNKSNESDSNTVIPPAQYTENYGHNPPQSYNSMPYAPGVPMHSAGPQQVTVL